MARRARMEQKNALIKMQGLAKAREALGSSVDLLQRKFHVAIPFAYSTAGYGFLFNMPGYGGVTVGARGTARLLPISRSKSRRSPTYTNRARDVRARPGFLVIPHCVAWFVLRSFVVWVVVQGGMAWHAEAARRERSETLSLSLL